MKKSRKKRALLLLLVFHIFCLNAQARKYEVTSPDRRITVQVMVGESVSYSVKYKEEMLVLPSEIAMTMGNDRVIGRNATITDSVRKSVHEMIIPVVKEKRSRIPDNYNELILKIDMDYELCFRAYADGVAYRFGASVKGELTVMDEQASFNFSPSALIYYPHVSKRADADIFHTSFEENYTLAMMDTLPESMMAFSPVLVTQQGLPKVLITESDLVDYPGMFLTKGLKGGLTGRFAPYPLKEIVSEGEFKQKLAAERAPYIAKTHGTRSFPWRVLLVAPTDGDLLINDLVYRLAPAPDFTDTEWIRPGLGTEEWITNLNLYGVDFKAGLNTATYKYYIDFAAAYGFEYVMLDAGWSDYNDLFKINPSMDMEAITRYAKEKAVGLILWTQALTMERQMQQAMEQFKKWHIKIVMTDFIDRDDQLAINFMHRFASECAKNKLMCMIHGAPKPAGFTRTWPNMLTREGVLGSEFNAWSARVTPEHNLLIPFIRMPAGPMDYEPGLLQHASKEHSVKMGMEKVIAQGTRMHQMAMFVVYESPLQLFAGNLSDAHREPELMTFLGKLPTVWDETRILQAELGKSVVEVRRNGSEWVIAAMNDWTPLDFTFTADFLDAGEYVMEVAADGINAERNPHDYALKTIKITAGEMVTIHLAPGGGYVARIYKK